MLETIFLHVGFDKTGSTSIQFTAHDSREILDNMGVLYPSGTWHPQLGSCFVSDPLLYYYNCASGRASLSLEEIRQEDSRYLADIEQTFSRASGNVGLLSYEGFCTLELEALHKMKGFLGGLAKSVKVLIYCRDPYEYALGAISQRALSGMPLWEQVPFQNFTEVLSNYGLAFGKENLIVRPFDRDQFLNGDIRFDFFSIIGLSHSQIELLCSQRDSTNSSLCQEALEIACELANYKDYRTSSDFGLRYAHHLQKIQGTRLRFTQEQFSAVKEQVLPHIVYLRDHFGIDFNNEKIYQYATDETNLSSITLKSIAGLIHDLAKNSENGAHSLEEQENAYLYRSVGYFKVISAAPKTYAITTLGGLLEFECRFSVRVGIKNLEARLYIYDSRRRLAFQTDSTLLGQFFSAPDAGDYSVTFSVFCDLPNGEYTLGFAFFQINNDREKIELANYGRFCDFSVCAKRTVSNPGYASLVARVEMCAYHSDNVVSTIKNGAGRMDILSFPESMVQGAMYQIQVEVFNFSDSTWTVEEGYPINLSYHWYGLDGNEILYDGHRTPLAAAFLKSGDSLIQFIDVIAPPHAGELVLVLTVVQEYVGWIEKMGFQPARRHILVQAGN